MSKAHSNATSLRGPTTSRYYNQTPATTTTTIPEAASAQQPQKQQQTTAIESLSCSLSLSAPPSHLTNFTSMWMAAVLLLCLSAPALKALSLSCSLLLSQWVKGERQFAKLLLLLFCFGLRVVHFGDMGGIFAAVSRAAYFSFIHLRRTLPTEIAPFFRSIRDGRGSWMCIQKKNNYKHKITLPHKENNAISIIAFLLVPLNWMRAFD